MNLTPVSAREVVHLLILRELSRVRDGSVVSLKGGVNLRLFFDSIRYSEDIDLDGEPEASLEIRNCIAGVFEDRHFTRQLQERGIRGLDPGEGPNKDSDTTYRYKFNLELPGNIRYPTKVEVSFRERYEGDEAVVEAPAVGILQPYGIESIPVRHYVRPAAVRQKIDALGRRREAQARDIFDLTFLVNSTPSDELLTFLADGLEGRVLEEARRRSLDISFPEYQGQVVEFLSEDDQTRFGTEEVWDALRLRVEDLVGGVLKRKRGE